MLQQNTNDFIENPFVNKKFLSKYNNETETKIELDQSNIGKYYRSVFVLAKKNKSPVPPEFYNWQIPKQIYDKVKGDLILYKTTIKIIKNKNHYNTLVILPKESIVAFNAFNYTLDDHNIIVPILNISFLQLLPYLEQYKSSNTLENLYNLKLINGYFNVQDSVNQHVIQTISSLEESNYWTNKYSGQINVTQDFSNRNFPLFPTRLADKEIAKIITDISKTMNSKHKKYELKEDYLRDLDKSETKARKTFSRNRYDGIVNRNSIRMYHIGKPSQFTRDDINGLFKTLDQKQRFLLFSNLMVSKQYCHLVVNNKDILKLMKDELYTFAPLYRYLLGYAWVRFYLEENFRETFVRTDDEFIFDIDTASLLPVFPFDHAKPKANPYMPILVSDTHLVPKTNFNGISDYLTYSNIANRGICNLDEFRTRLNIFCTGNSNNNIFSDLDFDKYQIGITGSIITACIQKEHPLMSLFNNDNKTIDEKFNIYFNEYYAKSDIDVMVKTKNTFTFIDSVRAFYEQIVVNLCKFNTPYAEPKHIKLELNKLGYVFVTEDFIKRNIDFNVLEQTNQHFKDSQDKLKYIINNINADDIKLLFRPHYDRLCLEKYSELLKDKTDEEISEIKRKYPDIFSTDCADIRVYINTRKTKDIKDINIELTYKYKIVSPYLNHSFELFPIKHNDFFGVVSRFHVPCVRGYYNGSNVYLTPSCISAHMTYMNLDYRYIAGTKDPLEILNKNRMRGFGTWLNNNEKTLLVKYIRNVPFWGNLYSVDKSTSDNIVHKNIFTTMKIDSKLFRPRHFNMDSFTDAMYVETEGRYNNTPPVNSLIQKEYSMSQATQIVFNSVNITEINYDSLNTIDKDGNVTPLKKWTIDTTWNVYADYYKNDYELSKVNAKPPSGSLTIKNNTSKSLFKKIVSQVNNNSLPTIVVASSSIIQPGWGLPAGSENWGELIIEDENDDNDNE